MKCPKCGTFQECRGGRISDTRPTDQGRAIRRRRYCPNCGLRFTTYERIDDDSWQHEDEDADYVVGTA